MDLKERITCDLMMLWFLMAQGRRDGRRFGRRSDQVLDPTRGKGRIVALLKIKDGLSAKELAQVLGIRVSSLNETLSKMEKAGLVDRRPSEADKRVILVYLTDEGRKVAVDDPEEADILDDFSEVELEQLSGYVSRMIANAERNLDEGTAESLRAAWEARMQFMASAAEGAGHPMPPFMPSFDHRGAPFPFDPRRR